jgi:hypothetical protein
MRERLAGYGRRFGITRSLSRPMNSAAYRPCRKSRTIAFIGVSMC